MEPHPVARVAPGGPTELPITPDIAVLAFLALRSRFFDNGRPVPFVLRTKRNTQDDPFDEYLATEVLAKLADVDCVKASGPLITPDLVLLRPDQCEGAEPSLLANGLDRILAIEVKKLERTAQRGVARASGLDYNSTPPCGKVRLQDATGRPVDVRCFYLFVCLESRGERAVESRDGRSEVMLTALALVDGNVLNSDFDLYLSVVGQREKRINLGSYGDGADRTRPMLIFSNPLGDRRIEEAPTLVHPRRELAREDARLRRVYEIRRSYAGGGQSQFFAFRCTPDVPDGWEETVLDDPFPMPNRTSHTSPRGRFRLPFRI